jgi:hypothetical protein
VLLVEALRVWVGVAAALEPSAMSGVTNNEATQKNVKHTFALRRPRFLGAGAIGFAAVLSGIFWA